MSTIGLVKNICVFCGSNEGEGSTYAYAAKALAQLLTKKNISLIYGGANVGLMAILANEMLNKQGHVIGVIPKQLSEKEVAHNNLTKLIVTENLSQRKTILMRKSDAFTMLPGGIGTLDEFFEIWTWCQLGFYSKPVGILNTSGYFDKLLEFISNMVSNKFLKKEHREMLLVEAEPDILLAKLMEYKPVYTDKWIHKEGASRV